MIYNTQKNKSDGLLESTDFQKKHLARCIEDPVFFIMEVLKTLDEHNQKKPIDNFPKKEYIKILIEELFEHEINVLEKTRQMIVTWTCLGRILHQALFSTGTKFFVMSKMEDDSDAHLDRIMHMIDELPPWLKPPGVKKKYGRIDFKHNKSEIRGFAQNPDAARQFTFTGGLIDEDEEQDQYPQCLAAIMPAVRGGGWLISVGTSKGKNHKSRVMTGEAFGVDVNVKTDVKHFKVKDGTRGYRRWTNASGIRCHSLHYSADPDKDEKWVAKEKKLYTPFAWQQEMEINRDVTTGNRVYPEFDESIHCCDLVFNRFRPLHIGFDYGYHHPAAVFFQFDDQDRFLILDELLGHKQTAHEFFAMTAQYILDNFKGARLLCAGDPAGEQVSDKIEKKNGLPQTSVRIAKDYGFRIKSKKRSIMYGIEIISELLKMRSDGQPGLFLDYGCDIMKGGFQGGYVWKEDRNGNGQDVPEKDGYFDHVFDGTRYGATNFVNPKSLKPSRQIIGNKQIGINNVFDDDDISIFNRFGKWSGLNRRKNGR